MKHQYLPGLALVCTLAIAAPLSVSAAIPETRVKAMPLPGGINGLARVLHVEAAPDQSRFFVEVIRRFYNLSLDLVMPDDRRDVEGYFGALSGLHAALAPFGANPSLSLKQLSAADKRTDAERLLHALGLRPPPQVALDDDRLAVARRGYLAAAGVDVDSILQAWLAGQAVSIAIVRDEVPLPLGVVTWRKTVFADAVTEDELASAILLQRRAACFYHALASLDEPTLGYLEAHPDFLASLFQRRAEVMTTFGRSIHIANGRVIVPGGEAAVPVWEDIVERKVTEPEVFIDAMLARDSGRFAFLYDTVAHLPEPVRQLVFHAPAGNSEDVIVRVKRLAHVFANVTPAWHVIESPMWRPPVDPAMWLNELRVSNAQLAAGFTRGVWEEITHSDDVTGAEKAAEHAAEKEQVPVDVGWLAERVFLDDGTQQRERYEMTLWAQRTLAGIATGSAADITSAIAACRGYARFGLLLLTLERMDVREPAIFRDAVIRAADIAERGGGDRERTSLALYQASLALIERLRLSRRIDADAATQLVRTLVQIPVDDQEPAAVAKWVEQQLAPAIDRRPAAPESPGSANAEAPLLAALGGPRAIRHAEGTMAPEGSVAATSLGGPAGEPSLVKWEGQPYRVDVAAAERARIATVRRAEERAGVASLDVALKPFRAKVPGGKKGMRQAASALAEALVAIVYAAHLPGDRPEMLQNGPWQRHDFGLDARPEQLRRRLAWLLSEERKGGGIAWHLRGSLLALDLALAPYHLRRINDDPPAPTINEGDRNSATVGVMLLNPFDTTDADRDRLTATLARGRAAIADRAHEGGDALLTLAQRAGFSEWRLQALRWRLADANAGAARDPGTTFAMIDQFWAGEPDVETIARLDRWGPSIVPLTGQLATRLPRPRAWEDFAGRLGTGVFATQVADVHLRTASFLASQQLPAALYRGAMAAAVQELIDRAPVRQFDDWSALVMYVRTLPSGRYEDYVAALTVDGPLRTIGDEEEDGHE